MKLRSFLFLTLVFSFHVIAADDKKKEAPPKGPLNETEKAFVGKWKGSRHNFHWEIERFPDRTFEIVFKEPDPDRLFRSFNNYAIGVWWIEGDEYKFEWTKWWGDDGDLGGITMEIIEKVEKNEVVTISDDDEGIDPNNVEIRVEKFKMLGWKLKPEEKKRKKKDDGPIDV
ncbi:MAG: hypothetical protein AAGJ79_00580 [Verrucomicrobiota bacterium]